MHCAGYTPASPHEVNNVVVVVGVQAVAVLHCAGRWLHICQPIIELFVVVVGVQAVAVVYCAGYTSSQPITELFLLL